MIDNIFNNRLNSLPEIDRRAMIDWLIDSLTPANLDVIDLRDEILVAAGVECVFCNFSRCVLHQAGIRNRYRCGNCRRTFRSTTGTVLQGIHLLEKWKNFVPLFLESRTIREIAKILGISTRTAFDWRHKALSALAEVKWTPEFAGIVEIKETMHKLNFKGCSAEKIKKFKETAKINDLNKIEDQLSVITVYERLSKTAEMQVVQRGVVSLETLSNSISEKIDNVKCMIVNSNQNNFEYWKSNQNNSILMANHGTKLVHEKNAKIESLEKNQMAFCTWICRFQGVASKYLNNYLNWYNLLGQLGQFRDKLNYTFGRILLGNTSIYRYRRLEQSFYQFWLSPKFATEP